MDEVAEVELFLNTVPLLAGLSREDKQRLVEGFYVHEYKGELLRLLGFYNHGRRAPGVPMPT